MYLYGICQCSQAKITDRKTFRTKTKTVYCPTEPLSRCLDDNTLMQRTHTFLVPSLSTRPNSNSNYNNREHKFFDNNFIHRKSNSSYSNSRLLEWLFLVWHEKWIGNAKRHTSLVSKTSSLIQDMKRSSPWGVLIPLEFNKK